MNDFWLEFATRRGMGKEFLSARGKGTEENVIRQIINEKEPDEKSEIKPETKNKGGEVTMRSEWYPNTDFEGKGEVKTTGENIPKTDTPDTPDTYLTDLKDKDSKNWYPKTDFPEKIEFTTPPLKGEEKSGLNSMLLEEFPAFVADRLEAAFPMSWKRTLHELSWFLGTATGGEFFDKNALQQMKDFQNEAAAAKDHSERKAVLAKITTYLRGMQSRKRR